jgi:hypothetical protein
MWHRVDVVLTDVSEESVATKTRYMDRIIREAIEIELHLDNMHREGGFCLSKSWKPLICSLKRPRDMTPDPQVTHDNTDNIATPCPQPCQLKG